MTFSGVRISPLSKTSKIYPKKRHVCEPAKKGRKPNVFNPLRRIYREFYGGEGGIRTLETLLGFTRFPVARPRPD